MIVLKLLNIDKFYGGGKNIEIAKGKHKMPENLKEGLEQLKRSWNDKRGS